MLTANKLIVQGQGLSRVLLDRAITVHLDSATPTGHHFETTDSQGRTISVSLAEGSQVFQGDVLVAEDGSLIRVEAGATRVHAEHDAGHYHGHVHGPDCGHDHGHAAVEIKPAHQPHVHGPGCNHDH
jgi:urease accessory protein